MTMVKTNKRFDQLTNLDISTYYKNIIFYVLPSDLLGAFAYWVTAQNPNKALIDMRLPLAAFNSYVLSFFDKPNLPEKLNYEKLKNIINEEAFVSIPDILELNKLKPDFIDLDVLARNVFFMILREHITQA